MNKSRITIGHLRMMIVGATIGIVGVLVGLLMLHPAANPTVAVHQASVEATTTLPAPVPPDATTLAPATTVAPAPVAAPSPATTVKPGVVVVPAAPTVATTIPRTSPTTEASQMCGTWDSNCHDALGWHNIEKCWYPGSADANGVAPTTPQYPGQKPGNLMPCSDPDGTVHVP